MRLGFGAAFLRAVRFTFLRSVLSVMLLVLATFNLLPLNVFNAHRVGVCEFHGNRDERCSQSCAGALLRHSFLICAANSAATKALELNRWPVKKNFYWLCHSLPPAYTDRNPVGFGVLPKWVTTNGKTTCKLGRI